MIEHTDLVACPECGKCSGYLVAARIYSDVKPPDKPVTYEDMKVADEFKCVLCAYWWFVDKPAKRCTKI